MPGIDYSIKGKMQAELGCKLFNQVFTIQLTKSQLLLLAMP